MATTADSSSPYSPRFHRGNHNPSSPRSHGVRGEHEPILALTGPPSLTAGSSPSPTKPSDLSPTMTAASCDPADAPAPPTDGVDQGGSSGGDAWWEKKSAWSMPANDVLEAGAVMGAISWLDLSEAVKSGVHHALNPDPYRGMFGSDGDKYAKDVQELIVFRSCVQVAAFISEAIQVVGGIIDLAPGYLPAVYKMIKKAVGLCIADEVQSGFARIESHFWGFEAHRVVPDIVTMAKYEDCIKDCGKAVERSRTAF